jgi:diacylglycerol kinase (ATP)
MIDPAHTTVIANPAARGGWVRKNWASLTAEIQRHLGRVSFVRTERMGHARILAREALAQGATTLVSFGGDGTHGEVAAGILDERASERCSFGIINAGTGGDFRKLLIDAATLEGACRTIAKLDAAPVDMGRIEYETFEGERAERYFLNLITAGIGGLVDRYVNESRFRLGGTLDYAVATLRANLRYEPAHLQVDIDGARMGEYEVNVVCVCNGRYAGGGMHFAPMARIADGLLEVVVIEAAPIAKSLRVGRKLYSGTHLNSRLVHHARGRRIELTPLSPRKAYLDVDGEAPGVAPAIVEVVPRAIRLHGPQPDVL